MSEEHDEIDEAVERYMMLPWRIELTPAREGGWFVRLPDLPYCMSQGETVDEALQMIRDAQRGWLRVALEKDEPIPEPAEPEYDPPAGYSGRFIVRIPPSLHRDLVRAAEQEGVSLNQFATVALARAVGYRTDTHGSAQVGSTRA
jgi:antitoxin HicB